MKIVFLVHTAVEFYPIMPFISCSKHEVTTSLRVPLVGTPIYKWRGCSSEILTRTPKRYQDPVLWAWLEMFSPLRGYQF